jgi:hypothetical protein
MVAPKPRSVATRKSTVRVAKKKQRVSKKQALLLIAVLVLIGVVAVVATQAATASRKVYVLTKGGDFKMIASDASSSTSYKQPQPLAYPAKFVMSPDKQKYLQYDQKSLSESTRIEVRSTSTGALLSSFSVPALHIANWASNNSTIVYSAYSKSGSSFGNNAIYSISSTGTNKKVIASVGSNFYHCFTTSPAGVSSRVAYIAGSQLWTMNLDGSGKKRLLGQDVTARGCPYWSPDGKKFAFTERINGNVISQYVMNADGTKRTSVANILFVADSYKGPDKDVQNQNDEPTAQVWSPGGTSVLFTRITNGINDLYMVNVTSKTVTKITKNTQSTTRVNQHGWSKDGRVIYAIGQASGRTLDQIKSVKTDGSDTKTLYKPLTGTTSDAYNSRAAWFSI